MYKKFLKRPFDVFLSLCALLALSPVFLILIIFGAIKMKGNPFFTQERPGKNEKIFKLIKFRSMTNEKDENGKLLPDDMRLTRYGRFLRSTSLDELPELINIIKGDMSIVGPRPLVPQYLKYYSSFEKQRHDVRPGLTGLAQISGRNALEWDLRFELDIKYIKNISFKNDIIIVLKTVYKVLKKSDVNIRGTTVIMDFDKYRQLEGERKNEQYTIKH